MEGNWIIESLKWVFTFWNEKQAEIWELVSTTPEEFKDGEIWTLALEINEGLKAIGYGLLVLFFAVSVCRSTINFRDFRRPEQGLRFFIRFVLAKTAVTYGIDLMTAVFNICGGIVAAIAGNMGTMAGEVSLPEVAFPVVANAMPRKLVTLDGGKNYVMQHMSNWCWVAAGVNIFVAIDKDVPTNKSEEDFLLDMAKYAVDNSDRIEPFPDSPGASDLGRYNRPLAKIRVSDKIGV